MLALLAQRHQVHTRRLVRVRLIHYPLQVVLQFRMRLRLERPNQSPFAPARLTMEDTASGHDILVEIILEYLHHANCSRAMPRLCAGMEKMLFVSRSDPTISYLLDMAQKIHGVHLPATAVQTSQRPWTNIKYLRESALTCTLKVKPCLGLNRRDLSLWSHREEYCIVLCSFLTFQRNLSLHHEFRS